MIFANLCAPEPGVVQGAVAQSGLFRYGIGEATGGLGALVVAIRGSLAGVLQNGQENADEDEGREGEA